MNPVSAKAAAVNVDDISKSYPNVRALNHVSLRVEQGEFFALLGPNGAGKTTLISILAGLTRADSGHASIMGHDTVSDYRQARKNLGVVPQELVYDPFSVFAKHFDFRRGTTVSPRPMRGSMKSCTTSI